MIITKKLPKTRILKKQWGCHSVTAPLLHTCGRLLIQPFFNGFNDGIALFAEYVGKAKHIAVF